MKTTLTVAVAAAGTLLAAAAEPASYSGSFAADPTNFACGYYGSLELCGGYALFSTPTNASSGDVYTESVSYSSPMMVPGSKTGNVAYLSLIDSTITGGPGLPGPDIATTQSVLQGYSGPAIYPFTGPYTHGYLSGYVSVAGYGSGYGTPNVGFSITGMTSQFDILTSDPYPIIGIAYGLEAKLPATPAVLSSFPGGSVGSPTILPAGLTGQISSDISGGASDSQFYTFVWNGGLLQTNGDVVGANPLADFQFQLFAVNGSQPVEGVTVPLDAVTLSSANAFSGLLSIDLAAGDYEIGMYTNSPYDPQFTIAFDTPVGSFVPEPGAWTMLIVGAASIGAALRLARRRVLTG